MGIGIWLNRLLGKQLKATPQLPEVLGYVTDKRGRHKPVRRGAIEDVLSDAQVQRVARLREVLAAACPMTLEDWTDSFLDNADPESAIRIVEACASVYQWLISHTSWSAHDKQQLYGVLSAISNGETEPEEAFGLPMDKGLPSFESIVSMYRVAYQAGSRP